MVPYDVLSPVGFQPHPGSLILMGCPGSAEIAPLTDALSLLFCLCRLTGSGIVTLFLFSRARTYLVLLHQLICFTFKTTSILASQWPVLSKAAGEVGPTCPWVLPLSPHKSPVTSLSARSEVLLQSWKVSRPSHSPSQLARSSQSSSL